MINSIITCLDYLERLALALVSRITPWAAPLGPAYLVARTVWRHFDTPAWIAVAVAITVEAVGIASTHITMEMWEWNQTRSKSLPAARFGVGLACVVVYFATGIFLTVALELAPGLVAYAPASLFVLAAVAYVTLVLMSSLARLREAAGEAKAERRAVRRSSGNLPSIPRQLPDWLPVVPDNLGDFKRLVAEGVIQLPSNVTGLTLAKHIPSVGCDSTGRYWLRQVRGQNGKEN